ncbi:hypothetical protein [Limnofasciculus baicalensis]|uniref:Uncharacterized protein n=1 Tax=Limnofasciculus baicalensis BBK-W-15 TaxID=2699891 RepID=A0AAE3KKS6_9CYAN|nr:hypothetical protein [Limnofasciculus baicalensis]MCP2727334.1 hypothetical protein [Limnofasciculus baicalensis BBK-W-15]
MKVELQFTVYNRTEQNFYVTLSSETKENETPVEVYDRLRLEAESMNGTSALEDNKRELEYEISTLKANLKNTTDQWNAVSNFLTTQGIRNAGKIDIIPGLVELIDVVVLPPSAYKGGETEEDEGDGNEEDEDDRYLH